MIFFVRNWLIPDRGRGGVALIIVLAFIVLLTGLIIAFFSRSIFDRQISNSSASEAKVSAFADGAASAIIGDLRQEIAAGSVGVTTSIPAGSGTVSTIAYIEGSGSTANQTFVPALVVSSGSAGEENLVKESKYQQSFFPVTGNYNFASNTVGILISGTTVTSSTGTVAYPASSRAASVSSTTASLNGRYCTPAVWNEPLLLPVTSGSDYTPALTSGTFTPPDWILVARDGSNPAIANLTGANSQYLTSGTNPVVGRYAYAIYNEGGLLDVNAAGAPSTTGTLAAYKNGLPFADLSQIFATVGLAASGAAPNGYTDILVAWRNYASIPGLAGNSFLAPSFTLASATSYYNLIASNTTGFLSVSGSQAANGQTDQMFTSRQELIKFAQNALGLSGTNLDVLRYLTHFSRDLNQPSLAPAWMRGGPTIVSGIGTPPSNPTSTSSSPCYADYGGGNNGYGGDSLINPSFLTVTATSAFTRNDGSLANLGEPLVKKRFALERLAWLTCKGPSGPSAANPGGRSLTDPDMAALLANPGVTPALLAQGTDQNIRNYFGLVWDTTNHLWNYAPGASWSSPITTGTTIAGPIQVLQAIPGREANFIELLKAAIVAGSLGKSIGGGDVGVNTNWVVNDGLQLMHIKDTTIDYHVMQIAANIIAQAKCDNYPPRINFDAGNGTGARLFAGVEDLPYFYRWKNLAVLPRAPIPGPSSTLPQTLTYSGLGIELVIPEIWNPHDPNTPLCAMRPCASGSSGLRVVADDTIDIPTPGSATAGFPTDSASVQVQADAGDSNPPDWGSTPSPAVMLNPSTTALVFSDSNGTLFREPTALRSPGIPAGSNLAVNHSTVSGTHQLLVERSLLLDSGDNYIIGTDGSVTDYREAALGVSHSYIGFYTGYFPIVIVTGSANKYVYDGKISGGSPSEWTNCFHNQSELTFRVQCQDPFGSWIDYDVKYWSSTGYTDYRFRSAWFNDAGNYTDATAMSYLLGWPNYGFAMDPRTLRFGVNASYPGQGGNPPTLDPSGAATAYNTFQISGSNIYLGTSRYGYNSFQPINNSSPNYFRCAAASGFSSNMPRAGSGINGGLLADAVFSQNNMYALCFQGAAGYYQDADGTIRRAMGAYTSPGYVGVSATTSSNVGLPTPTATTGWQVAYGAPVATAQSQSRPTILHRPFRSVAELGFVFRDVPWKQLDFFTPESGDGGLLDVFCIHDNSNAAGLMAGKVNLNTRQAPVLEAILSGAMRDQLMISGTTALSATSAAVVLQQSEISGIANDLVARTGTAPLTNVSDLVGAWVGGSGTNAAYSGFSRDLTGLYIGTSGSATNVIQRFREAAIRPLAACGSVRVWNLLIDVIAQTGRYPASASGLNQFLVEGENRRWVHVAIDRYTGQILDSQVENITE